MMKTFQCLNELKINQGKTTVLNEIYTELYITEGDSGGVNKQHEVRQIETASRRTKEDTPIKCNDIFKPVFEQDKPIKTVLTKGITGIGKTVSVQKFILDWAEWKANQDIHLIFSLPFRELNLMKDQKLSLMELLHVFFKEIKETEMCSLEKVLFIFDGLDECRFSLDFQNTVRVCDVTESASVPEQLINLIKWNLLPSALIWITSRPAAADQIPSECVHRVTEIGGFSDPQKEYFRKRISDQILANNIITHLKALRSLYIMCHIPVFCWISATVLERMLGEAESGEIPKTLTQMYTHFLIIQTNIIGEKFHKKQEKNEEIILKLGQLAFQQLIKRNLIFYEEDLRVCGLDVTIAAVSSGVYTQIFREEFGLHQSKVYCFVHLSVQEHLAALYVHLTFMMEKRNVLVHYCEEITISNVHNSAVDQALKSQTGHLDLFLHFLLGLSLKPNQNLLNVLLTKTGSSSQSTEETIKYIKKKISLDLPIEKSISLFHCLNELGDHCLFEEIQHYLSSEEQSELSISQWSALIFVLLTYAQELEVFDLSKYICTDKITEAVLLKVTPVIAESKKAIKMDLSENKLGHSEVKSLSAILENPQCEVETLCVRNCGISYEGCAALISALSSNPSHLRDLKLSYNNVGDSGVKSLAAVLKNPQSKLERLWLEDCKFTDEGCAALTSALKSNPSHLRSLRLSKNKIGDLGVKDLSVVLENPHCKLRKLSLCECDLSDKGCHALTSALKSNSSYLRELDLSCNKLGDLGVMCLSAALENPQFKLETIKLSKCGVSYEGCAALTKALRANPSHLKKRNLSDNKIGDSGVRSLTAVLENPLHNLQILRLSDCGVSDEVCAALTSALILNPSYLKELNLRCNNKIGDLGKKLLSALKEEHYKEQTLIKLQDEGSELPTLSCISMKSEQSMGFCVDFKDGDYSSPQRHDKESSAVNEFQKEFKVNLMKKFQCLNEVIINQGNQTVLNEIYTDLYITEGDSGGVNKQHEGICFPLLSSGSPPDQQQLIKSPRNVFIESQRYGGLMTHRRRSISGRGDQMKEEYFRKRISDQILANNIITHLKALRSLYIMCHIPVFCWISATVLERMLGEAESGEIPKTLTQMYTHFLIIQTNIIREKFKKKQETDEEIILKLGQLAFQQLKKGNLIFYEEDLRVCGIDVAEAAVYSGVCTQIFKEEFVLHQSKVYCFVHLSVQEHLAALYVHLTFMINALKQDWFPEQKIKEFTILDVHKSAVDQVLKHQTGHLDLFLRFLLGLSLKSNQNLLNILLPQTGSSSVHRNDIVQYIKKKISEDLTTDKSINLFQCLNEMGDHSLVEEIQHYLKSGKQSELSSSQWSALVFVLLTSVDKLEEFDLSKYISTDKITETVLLKVMPVIAASKKAIIRCDSLEVKGCSALVSVLSSETSNLKELHLTVKKLDLTGKKLEDSVVNCLSAVVESLYCKVETLRLRQCDVSPEGCAALISAVRSNPSHLRELDLSYNNVGDSGVKCLSEILENSQCKLESLMLCKCGVSDEGCAAMTSALTSNPSHLRELALSDNKVGGSGVKGLSAVLKNPQCKLEKLRLYKCGVSNEGCATLTSALRSNPSHLRELTLSYNNIGDSGVKCLSAVLENPHCKLTKLWLCSCCVSHEGCVALSSALRSNPSHLRDLALSFNKIGDSGVKCLSAVLESPQCNLDILWLRTCDVTDEGCAALTSALKLNPSHLRELYLSWNKIGDSGKKQLSALKDDKHYNLQILGARAPRSRPEWPAPEGPSTEEQARMACTRDFQNTVRVCDVSESASVPELLINLIKGNLLPSALIWITSQTAAADQIPSECVHRVTEIRGFNDPQKEEYFRKRITDQILANNIITHLKALRSLFIMCHITVFCWISATVLERLLCEAESGEIPKTLTQMYTHFLIIQTEIIKEKYSRKQESDEEMLLKLGKLAFQQPMEGNLIFYEKDLRECGIDAAEAAVYSGVCTQIFKEEFGFFQTKIYCFVHLSVQEHLAAHVHLTFMKATTGIVDCMGNLSKNEVLFGHDTNLTRTFRADYVTVMRGTEAEAGVTANINFIQQRQSQHKIPVQNRDNLANGSSKEYIHGA
ncbi:NACHT, LRR and PYD domains-containing protein 12-like [Silurus meridionalis]|nr:NACHT, LRR and PYD domains-containing protein 12-like [Silurus meridionalis]